MNTRKGSFEGLKISVIYKWMVILTCLMAVGLFASTRYALQSYAEMERLSNEYVEMEQQALTVRRASDFLTTEVNEFLVTGDVTHLEEYFEEVNVTKRRETAVNELAKHVNISYEDVQMAFEESQKLMEREIYAMKLACVSHGYRMENLPEEIQQMTLEAADLALTPDEQLEKARQMVHDESYNQSKDIIYAELNIFVEKVMDGLDQKMLVGEATLEHAMHLAQVGLVALVCLNLLIAVALVKLVLTPLNQFLTNVREESMLTESGAYEFRHLAKVYNKIYWEKEESEHQKKMFQYKAEHDLMTGVLNRSTAEDQIRELMEDTETPGVLILLDLDDLKGINDTFGHDEGDKAISGTAKILMGHFNNKAVIGRIGGDEFLIYLPGAANHRDTVSLSMTSLLRKLAGISVGGAEDRRVHCSVGCAAGNGLSGGYEELFKKADTALYQVKRAGKNQFAFYTPEMELADYHFKQQRFLADKDLRKVEDTELRELLGAIASYYQLVVSTNLSKNNYCLMVSEVDDILSDAPAIGHLDQFMKAAAKNVHGDDLKEFAGKLSRDALIQGHHKGVKNVRHYFRFRQPEGYRWVECNVILYNNEMGDICDFAMMRWADEYSNR